MKAVRRSINKELCKDCPIMRRCRDCYNCNECRALTVTKMVGLIGFIPPNECFCMAKCDVNDVNKNSCILKEIAIYEGGSENG